MLASAVAAGNAQERRRAPDGAAPQPAAASAPITLPSIPYDRDRPLVGVWEGTFNPGPGESARFVVVVEYLNGGYQVYSLMHDLTHAMPALQASVRGDTLVWENRNSGGGFLVYTGRLSGRNALSGVLTFRDFEPLAEHRANPPTFSLRRRASR